MVLKERQVYGDNDDQYWNRRLPFRLSLDISCCLIALGRSKEVQTLRGSDLIRSVPAGQC